ncbi:MAG TPA: hypothetical protein VFS77_23510 [Pyrinomonadaceae bacterium]|nr:hypothetical protein [Pyrinomonadaceae bacterium]
MYLKYSRILLLVLLPLTVFGQTPRAEPAFDIAGFNKKFEIVQWLVAYDTVAWKTSDLVMAADKAELARLGREWFCFQDSKSGWHAVYGKLENNSFDQVFHYVVDGTGKIERTADKIDEQFLIAHAKALQLALKKINEVMPAGSPTHNTYIKRNDDQSFNVWVFPAFQPNSVAVYGGEFVYTIDAVAQKITRDDSYFQGAFRGFNVKPPREIWLNYREKEKPTLGSIFFVWYYKEYFTKIYIDNAKSTSSLIKNGSEYMWVHAEKDQPPAGVNKAKP